MVVRKQTRRRRSHPTRTGQTARHGHQGNEAGAGNFSGCVDKANIVVLCEEHKLPAESESDQDDEDQDGEDADVAANQDFMHGFTAVYGINKGIQKFSTG